MKRLLVMCSTKRRPQLLKEMLISFLMTKSFETKMVIYIQESDSKINEYREVIKEFENFSLNLIHPEQNHIKFIVGPSKETLVQVLNYLYKLNADEHRYDYFADINDDHVYKTQHWDAILIDKIELAGGWGVACGADLVNQDWYEFQRPSAPVVSANILGYLGYWCPPTLEHLGCDEFHKLIGITTNLIHVPTVIIEHKCYNHIHKREKDENDVEIYNDVAKSERLFTEWKQTHLEVLKTLYSKALGAKNED